MSDSSKLSATACQHAAPAAATNASLSSSSRRLSKACVMFPIMQVSAAIAQTMATYVSGHALLSSLFGGKAPSDQIAQCLVASTYRHIASVRIAGIILTEQDGIAAVYKTAFLQCTPPSRRRTLLSADAQAQQLPSANHTARNALSGIAGGLTQSRRAAAATATAAAATASSANEGNKLWQQLRSALSVVSGRAGARKPANQASVGIAGIPGTTATTAAGTARVGNSTTRSSATTANRTGAGAAAPTIATVTVAMPAFKVPAANDPRIVDLFDTVARVSHGVC